MRSATTFFFLSLATGCSGFNAAGQQDDSSDAPLPHSSSQYEAKFCDSFYEKAKPANQFKKVHEYAEATSRDSYQLFQHEAGYCYQSASGFSGFKRIEVIDAPAMDEDVCIAGPAVQSDEIGNSSCSSNGKPWPIPQYTWIEVDESGVEIQRTPGRFEKTLRRGHTYKLEIVVEYGNDARFDGCRIISSHLLLHKNNPDITIPICKD